MYLTEQHEMIQEVARSIANEHIEKTAAEIDQEGKFPWDNIKLLAENGLFGVHVPEAFGGAGSDMLSQAVVVEEIARVCASTSAVLTTQALSLAPFLIGASGQLKEKYVTPLARGEALGSFGITEPGSGSDVASLKTTAVADGDYYLINGQKVFITNAGESEIYVIVARTSEHRTQGVSLLVVEKGTPGLSFGKSEDKMGLRGSVTKEVFLEDVKVPKENMIGAEGEGFKILMEVFNETRPIIGAQATGIAQGAFDYCLNYVQERKQFGKPIASFQMIQSMLADMVMKIEASRLLTYKAINQLEKKEKNIAKYASIAKCFASDTAMEVTTDAVQLLGGYGYIKDYPVERMMRDAKITQIYEGTNQIQRVIIAKQLLDN